MQFALLPHLFYKHLTFYFIFGGGGVGGKLLAFYGKNGGSCIMLHCFNYFFFIIHCFKIELIIWNIIYNYFKLCLVEVGKKTGSD